MIHIFTFLALVSKLLTIFYNSLGWKT